MYMGTIGGANNFCLQKSSMLIGRIGIFIKENVRKMVFADFASNIAGILKKFPLSQLQAVRIVRIFPNIHIQYGICESW